MRPNHHRAIHRTAALVVALLAAACGSRIDEPEPGAVVGASSPGAVPAEGPADAAVVSDTAGPDAPAADASSQAGVTQPPGSGAALGAAGPPGVAGTPAPARQAPVSPDRTAVTTGQPRGNSQPAGPASRTEQPATPSGTAGEANLPDAVHLTGPNSQGVSDSEIKIGVLAPLSGAAGFLGELEVDAVKAYFADMNARGGVKGRRYRLVTADTRMESNVEATAARRLVEQEKVFALITPFANSVADYVSSIGIPTTAFGNIPQAFSSKFPNVYPVGFHVVDTDATMAYVLTQVLKLPIKSVSILYETANVPWGDWAEYAKKAWEYWGVEVKSVDRFNISDGDCTQLVLKVKSLQIDFWQVAQSLGWPLCQQAMARQNYTPPLGRGGPYTRDLNFVGQAGAAAADVYGLTNGVQVTKNKGTPWPYDPSGVAPEIDHFVDTMKRYSPKSADVAGLEGIWAQTFWSQAKLLHEALRRQAEAVTWKGTNQWIQSQKRWSSGLVSPASFDPKCKTASEGLWLFQYKWDGQRLVETDWHPYGGFKTLPVEAKNHIVPGAGHCYLTAMADAKL